jgi:hypothetical protein
MSRQYVAVHFRPGDKRTYTYHWDGEPVACGDQVKVPDRSGDGWSRVTVAEISWQEPKFATKPILGPVKPEDTAAPAPAPKVEEQPGLPLSPFDTPEG